MARRPDAATAYDYAWWLTGDEQAAAAAVRRALARPAVARTGGDDERLATLLREVRAAAPAPAMCPASELALLHDGHGVALDDAAALVAVDAADCPTELAHGRLEALTDTVVAPLAHPERLGGLAVGNPADVAHARQCDGCAATRTLIERGRAEVRALPRPAPPSDLDGDEDAPGTPGAGRGARRRMAVVWLAVVVVVMAVIAFALLGVADAALADAALAD